MDRVHEVLRLTTAERARDDGGRWPRWESAAGADSDLPAEWHTHWLQADADAEPIFVAETGAASAPVMLLVHGLGTNGLRDWLPIASSLARRYRLVLVDLPGFGHSPAPSTKLSPTHYSELLQLVKTHFSKAPIAVVGHSMGGATALRYAWRYPQDVHRVGLIDAAGILQRTAFVKHSTTGRLDLNDETLGQGLLHYASRLQQLGDSLIERALAGGDPLALLGKSDTAWGLALGRYPNLNAALALIEEDFSAPAFETQQPVALLWGGRDPVAPLRTGYALQSTLPNAHLTVIDDAAHVPMSTHPARVVQWVDQWMGRPPVRNAPAAEDPAERSEGDYICRDEHGVQLEGRYRSIELLGCQAVVLKDVTAQRITAHNSTLELHQTDLLGEPSMELNSSAAIITGGALAGGVTLHNARLDVAGTHFTRADAIAVTGRSAIVASISRQPGQYLHGDYRVAPTADVRSPGEGTAAGAP